MLHATSEQRLDEYAAFWGGAEKLLHFGSRTTGAIHLRLVFHDGESYETRLAPTASDNLYAKANSFTGVVRLSSSGPPDEEHSRGACPRELANRVGNLRVYHLQDTGVFSPMLKTAKLHDNAFLRPDGSNLAAFLYLLKEKYSDAYSSIRQAIQRVAPFFDDFQLEPLRLNPEDIKLQWRHRSSDLYFDASSLSDGTLRFIALATLFLQPVEYRPSIILVDEPELGLHPAAIEILAALMRQASVDTQIIAATQSSLLLDHFAPEDVLVANRVEGGTQLKRLQPADLSEWLDDYSLGQLWEKNEIGGRPVPD